MEDATIISRKTPKYRRPVEKDEFSLSWALRKTPLVLTKTRRYTIGSLKKHHVSLPQQTTSSLHASLKWEKKAFMLRDEKSTNGTFLNDKRVEEPVALADGDRIKVGKYVIQFHVKKVRVKKVL